VINVYYFNKKLKFPLTGKEEGEQIMVENSIEAFSNASLKKISYIKNDIFGYFLLSVLAGIYVGLGVILVFSIGAPLKAAGDAGIKALMGASFGVALTLVIFAGSELFTGNNLIMTIGFLNKKVSTADVIKLWLICYLGNLAGSLLFAYIISFSGVMSGETASVFISKAAVAKGTGAFGALFWKGFLCNLLVCLAVWTSGRTKNDTAKILLIFWCLFAFIGSGYEHSVANMTLIAVGKLVGGSAVTWQMLWNNLLPVTLGNMAGGCMLGIVYYIISRKNLTSNGVK
jgi:nitrite transporter NirC